ncbi:MAG TPA: hydrogenase subunit MbhD domain-containing protein [Candidatus Thermoplasmatota archaeon]|mgnify:FL=1|nr:hydrogenase subunit MbhD domain-containing protein [Candidatus Thermoplasmatota archaeon]
MILEILLLFLVAASIFFVAAKTLLKSLVFLSLNTLLLVIILFLLQAPDVAITMAVVGTGATTVLYLSAIKKLGGIY